MKLNIDKSLLDQKTMRKKPVVPTGFESPVGWWSVTTEGDCEGRSTRQCGTHYGHVAEIAFSLADQGGYTLYFIPALERDYVPPRVSYQAKGGEVHITFCNGFMRGYDADVRATTVRKWLDAGEDIMVLKSNYYEAVLLRLL